jgi:hypothetical protein
MNYINKLRCTFILFLLIGNICYAQVNDDILASRRTHKKPSTVGFRYTENTHILLIQSEPLNDKDRKLISSFLLNDVHGREIAYQKLYHDERPTYLLIRSTKRKSEKNQYVSVLEIPSPVLQRAIDSDSLEIVFKDASKYNTKSETEPRETKKNQLSKVIVVDRHLLEKAYQSSQQIKLDDLTIIKDEHAGLYTVVISKNLLRSGPRLKQVVDSNSLTY